MFKAVTSIWKIKDRLDHVVHYVEPNSSSIAHFPAPMGDAKKLPLWYHQDRKESLHVAVNRHRR